MVNTLRVMLWDEEIGRLAWDNRRRLSYFTKVSQVKIHKRDLT